MAKGMGMLALIGGGEWTEPCRALDERLLAASGGGEVVVLPTAAAFEHPERAVARAVEWFAALGASAQSQRPCWRRFLSRLRRWERGHSLGGLRP